MPPSNILETLAGGKPMNFTYWDKGNLATIGRNKAVADLPYGIRFGGFFPRGSSGRRCTSSIWWVTAAAWRSSTEWAWNYVTFYRGSRLITGTQDGQDALAPPGGRVRTGGAPPDAVTVEPQGASKP